MNIDLREIFGDIDEETFESGSPLIGRGEWIDPDVGEEDPDAPHPEWEPFEPEDEEVVAAAPEDPEPEPVPKPQVALVDCGPRLISRAVADVEGFNTIEVASHFELSA
jgi:hypothetical protein